MYAMTEHRLSLHRLWGTGGGAEIVSGSSDKLDMAMADSAHLVIVDHEYWG